LISKNRPVTPNQPTTDFSTKPVLMSDKVVLRPFCADDVPEIAAIIDPEVRKTPVVCT
jgi:hypothetical protein